MPANPKNPFVHSLQLSTLQKVKMGLMAVTVLPVRAVIAFLLIFLATCLAWLGLYDLEPGHLDARPFTGWRLWIRKAICFVLRSMFFIVGFHRVKIIGKQASPREAKILAVAPHSTFFDALPVVVMGAPSVVAKAETNNMPFWGSLIKYTQPVLVHRDDPNSRQNTIKQIVERSESDGDWQQVLIFPEGTCTNRSCLITFRTGAFMPGVAVQPVLIRYDNWLDTVTWTWEGLSALQVLFYSLTQFNLNCTVQYLDPYVPDEEERRDSKLFAANVRAAMAQTLGVPTTDCNYFDYLRIAKSQSRGKALQRLQRKLEEPLLQTSASLQEADGGPNQGYQRLADTMSVAADMAELRTVLDTFSSVESAQLDVRHFRLAVLMAASADCLETFFKESCQLFDKALGPERVSRETAQDILVNHIFLSLKEASKAVEEIAEENVVSLSSLETLITQTKPQYSKVIKAMESHLSNGVTDLLAKSASMTAELMAARLEKVAASGSSLVSEVTATVAAGTGKMTVALSSAVTSLHKRTSSQSDKKNT